MSEFNALRSRVEETAARLAVAQGDRRDRNRSLLETVARLEAKFAAQEKELTYYRDRVRPLEAANAQLGALMSRLLDMVDSGLGEDSADSDPVRAATAMAAAMLDRDLVPVPAEPVMDAADPDATEDLHSTFDNIDDATLAAESSADEDDDGLPPVVRLAAETATGAAEPAELDAEAVDALALALGPQTEDGDSPHPTAADIRALLERVEAAAAQARTANPAAPKSARAPRQTGAAA